MVKHLFISQVVFKLLNLGRYLFHFKSFRVYTRIYLCLSFLLTIQQTILNLLILSLLDDFWKNLNRLPNWGYVNEMNLMAKKLEM